MGVPEGSKAVVFQAIFEFDRESGYPTVYIVACEDETGDAVIVFEAIEDPVPMVPYPGTDEMNWALGPLTALALSKLNSR